MNRCSKKLLVVILLFCSHLYGQQTDSIHLTLDNAEKIFLNKNLYLLSQQYQVSAAKAIEIQAGLFNNPVFTTELDLKAKNKPWFDIGSNGQKAFSVDQLVEIAGKRNKRMLLAKAGTRQEEFALYDLVRTLKFQLRESFISLSYSNNLIEQLDRQVALLQQIIDAYQVQAGKRNVSMKDVVRLKTEMIQLNSQRNDIALNAIDARQDLQVLLDTSAFIIPQFQGDSTAQSPYELNDLIQKAFDHRSDLQLLQSRVEQSEVNIRYQQALAKPDINIGAGYDQNGSYAPQYFNIHAGIALPFFNRNQGNIKSAREQWNISKTELRSRESNIQAELAAALEHIKQSDYTYRMVEANFEKDYPAINRGIIENFNKGNISILEFLDFFESYNSALEVINQAKKDRALALEQLEFVVGTPVK